MGIADSEIIDKIESLLSSSAKSSSVAIVRATVARSLF